MATITSQAVTGDYHTGSSWVGGEVPVGGVDNAVIASGAVITATAAVDVGDGTGNALTVNGTLTITDAALTCRGGLYIDGICTFNGVDAEFVTGAGELTIEVANDDANYWYINGSSLSVSGTGYAKIFSQYNDGGHIHAAIRNGQQTVFTGFGNASNWAFTLRGSHSFVDTRITECGQFWYGNTAEGGYSTFENFTVDEPIYLDGNPQFFMESPNGGTRIMNQCVLRCVQQYVSLAGFDISECVLEGTVYGDATAIPPNTWENVFYHGNQDMPGLTTDGWGKFAATINRFYCARSGSNPHYLQTTSAAGNHTYSNIIFEQLTAWEVDDGDSLEGVPTLSEGPQVVTLQNALVLPNADTTRRNSGTIVSAHGNANQKIRVVNCTGYGIGVAVSEDNESWEDQFPEIKNNIIWAESGETQVFAVRAYDPTVAGAVTTADYNGLYNITNPYDCSAGVITNTPGTHDTIGNPQFLDATRDLRAYGRANWGLSGTDEQQRLAALNILYSKWDSTSEWYGVSVSDLYDWVWTGFTPMNPAFLSGSDTGGYLGAVEPVSMVLTVTNETTAAAGSTPSMLLYADYSVANSATSVTGSHPEMLFYLECPVTNEITAVTGSLPVCYLRSAIAFSLTQRFPVFASLDSTLVEQACADAAQMVDEEIWGALTERGQSYLAAHYLTVMYANTNSAPQAPVTSRRVGDVQVDFAVGVTTFGIQSDYASTKYGQEYLRLCRMVSPHCALV